MRKGIVFVATGIFSSTMACSPLGDSDIAILGSEAGLRAWMDGQNGLVVTGKSQPNVVSEWGSLRESQGEVRRSVYKVRGVR